MIPRVGGEYVYVSRAFGPAAGFVSGWVALIVGFAAPTGVGALGFASYVHAVAPALPPTAVAVALIVLVTAVHMIDVRFGARVQAGLAGLVVAVIVVFVAAAAATGRLGAARLTGAVPVARQVWSGGFSAAAAFAIGLVQVSYAYSGWNGAAYVAGEVRDPARALPRALVLGTGLVTLLYLALNVVFLMAVPPVALAGQINVAHIAASALFGARGADLVSSLVALTAAGFVSAMLMSGPRVAVAMGEDGAFFRALGRGNARGAPTLAVALQGALAIVAVLTAAFDRLLVYVGFTLTLNAAAAVLAAFVLRRREPGRERPHRALGWPFSGLLFLCLSAFMLVLAVRERPTESAAGLATLLAGGIAYAAWHRRRRRT
jgi:APA family basic amino acid/polyamine antiporter